MDKYTKRYMLKTNIPWCEKYRPTTFATTVLEENNRIIFESILSTSRFPNLLFYGPPGVGKTTSAENLINTFQKMKNIKNKENIIHLNASDERGIEVIRNQIYQFVKSKNMFQSGYKFVILDEVDYMTKNAQQALKNLLQCCDKNVKFCLICNYICKIEASLKNEFICIRFNQLPTSQITHFLKNIAREEKLNLEEDTINNIQNMYNSDIRSMVNFLQLHQEKSCLKEYLLDNSLWKELHELFQQESIESIYLWFGNIKNSSSNIDFKSCLKKFFNYIVENEEEYVDYNFLNICETLLHTTDNKYVIPYFIENVFFHYKKLKIII